MKMKSVQSIHPCKSVIQTIYDIITKGHNVTLEVDTEEGLGSEFIVSLPVGWTVPGEFEDTLKIYSYNAWLYAVRYH